MTAFRWKSLTIVVAAHAGVIAFILAASNRDRTSEPTMATNQTEFGAIRDWVAQPFAFGTCLPGTASLVEEPYISGDEGLGRPVYRCTGWTRPLLWFAAAFLSVAVTAALLSLAAATGLGRRS
jgi:hypothetical protein